MNSYLVRNSLIAKYNKRLMLAACALICGAGLFSNFTKAENVNIILISADDMGIGRFKVALEDLDTFGFNPSIQTRDKSEYTLHQNAADAKKSISNLAELASEGTYFDNAFSTSPWCSPSRLGLLTGTYPHQNKVWAPQDILRHSATESSFFLNELFQTAGYVTGIIGKWHLSNSPLVGRKDEQYPTNKGFDQYWGFDHSGTVYYNSVQLESNTQQEDAKGFLTHQLLEESIKFIESNMKKNFFLYLPFNAPHGPLDLAPKEYYDLFDHRDSYLSNHTIGKKVTNAYSKNVNYHAHVKALDKTIAGLVEYLRASGLSENTMIVFTSDHGAPGFDDIPLPANSPYTGYKGQVAEGALRVPLFFWSDGDLITAQVNNQLVSHMDLMSTCLDICGIDIPNELNLQGKSLKPFLNEGTEESLTVHNELIWAGYVTNTQGFKAYEISYYYPRWMVQSDNYKLIYDKTDSLRLFHRDDFLEADDLSQELPLVVGDLHRRYEKWYSEVAKQPYKDEVLYEALNPKNSALLLSEVQ